MTAAPRSGIEALAAMTNDFSSLHPGDRIAVLREDGTRDPDLVCTVVDDQGTLARVRRAVRDDGASYFLVRLVPQWSCDLTPHPMAQHPDGHDAQAREPRSRRRHLVDRHSTRHPHRQMTRSSR